MPPTTVFHRFEQWVDTWMDYSDAVNPSSTPAHHRARKLFQTVLDAIDGLQLPYDAPSFELCGVPLETLAKDPLDFRSVRGRTFKTAHGLSDTRKFRKLQTQLRTLHDLLTKLFPSGPPLSNLPDALRQRVHAVALSWWVRRRMRVQGQAVWSPWSWRNDSDFVTLEPMTDVPRTFLMTTTVTQLAGGTAGGTTGSTTGGTAGGTTGVLQRVERAFARVRRDTFVFDVRTLFAHLTKSTARNPYTNKPFDASFLALVQERVKTLHDRGYSLDTEHDAPPPPPKRQVTESSVHQRLLSVVSGFNALGYMLTVDMFAALSPDQLVRWYKEGEDIWNYRAQLTSAQQREIVPSGIVFPHRARLRPGSWQGHFSPLEVRNETWKTMDVLINSGVQSHHRASGANYVAMALTLCSPTFAEACPALAVAASLGE